MFEGHYNLTRCFICRPSTHQSKIILKTLLKDITTISIKNRIEIQSNYQCEDHQGLLFLIRMMDLERQTLNHASSICKHNKIYHHFKKATSYDSRTLNYLCKMVATKISEKYYHMWLLETQVKNAAHRIISEMLDQRPNQQHYHSGTIANHIPDGFIQVKTTEKLENSSKQSRLHQINQSGDIQDKGKIDLGKEVNAALPLKGKK